NKSQEFHVIAATGEDDIAYCPNSAFAANVEAAEALPLIAERGEAREAVKKTATPGKAKCEAVAEFLGIALERTIKSIVLATDNEGAEPTIWLLMLRGDHELNEVKVGKLPGLAQFRFATEEEIVEWFGTPPGYLGPVGTRKPVKVIADRTVAHMSDFVVGSNEANYHTTGVNWGRDLPEPIVADIRNVRPGDPSPDGKGTLDICRGIEVGHVFQLGTKYSEAMGATFLDETGKPQPMVMGCYGIGVTRILGAAIEQNYDERGIIWPEAIAPFEIVLCPMGYDRSDAVREATDKLYGQLVEAGIDVVLDDRGERPGVMFADWELIGVPHRLVIGDRGLKDGKIEYQGRRDAEPTLLPVDEAAAFATNRIRVGLEKGAVAKA
ncbi:MAG TPA: proline--tRNA ligase, partial [Trinickia sp.]|uniref:proline--tRNA ligase n=1 Tax=Trinickia sp. TaxID=2571163 RepID=UPI002C08BED7